MGTFQSSLKKCFFVKNTQAASPNGRIVLLDANGENAGSSPLTTMAMMLARDVFFIDDNVDTPSEKITGTVNGMVLQYIRRNSHRYLVKKTGDGEAAICQLKDDDSTKYADGTTAVLDGTQGDVMVKLPEFYYKCVETSTTHKWKVTLALKDPSGTMEHWDGTQLIGAYEGYVTGNMLYSRSGVQSTGSVSQANFKTYAAARGTGYTIMKWQQHNIFGLLFYAMYGTTDSQGVIGSGTDSYNKATGQTNSIGMADTVQKNDGSINFWGVENAWGNKAELIHNVVVDYNANGNQFKITEDDGTVRTVVSQKGTNAHVFPTKMVLGNKFDLIAAPDNVKGNTSKGYCDGFYLANTSSRVVCVSGGNSDAGGGVAYAGTYIINSSGSNANFTARLAFKGTLTRYTDVNAFEQL